MTLDQPNILVLVICQKIKTENFWSSDSIIIMTVSGYVLSVLLDYNYALSQTATQSTTNTGRPASEAIDGDLSNWSQTNPARNQWWKVDVGKRIILREVAVYVRNDCTRCGE